MYEGMLFDLALNVEYYVESDGVKSPTYLMTLVDLPAVKTLDLEYRFPAYTRLPPRWWKAEATWRRSRAHGESGHRIHNADHRGAHRDGR